MRTKLLFPAVIGGTIVSADIATKRWALGALEYGETVYAFGGALPLTLAFNRGAAFSLHVGEASRWVFILLSIAALVVLVHLFRGTSRQDVLRLVAISLVGAGAFGNLIDRVRWAGGVVDFLGPIDLGLMLWPIFNVADMAITTGALLLAISIWRESQEPEPARAEALAEGADVT